MSIPSSQPALTSASAFREQLFDRVSGALGSMLLSLDDSHRGKNEIYRLANRILQVSLSPTSVLNIGFTDGVESIGARKIITPTIFQELRELSNSLKNRTTTVDLFLERTKLHREKSVECMSLFLQRVETVALEIFEHAKMEFAASLEESKQKTKQDIAGWRQQIKEFTVGNQQIVTNAEDYIASLTEILADNNRQMEMLENSSLATLLTQPSEE